MDWDSGFLIFIQEHLRSDALTPALKVITHTCDSGWIWILLCVALLVIPKTRRPGAIAGASLALEAIITNLVIKNAVGRTRPYEAVNGLVNLIEKQKDYSFPSGHTGASFAVAGVLLLIALIGLPVAKEKGIMTRSKMTLAYKLFALLTLIYATIIAYSRLYVGVHYPTDVLGGLLLGLGTSVIVYYAYHVAVKKLSDRKDKTQVNENAAEE
jgi:undecaprenyl-diphosphatase